ncbi:kinase [Aureimonas sp. Leaf454]|uniref:carbohydrate kinase family protein n=1 Tax=Aureimonas sp. Leaf454 TaxID=1736381 RepID=UPI0006FCBABA|nr:sugar kinase [Aureimonas sp. Leaf454]KQT52006.1 kinase [Aureimonas sp. Leaf454]
MRYDVSVIGLYILDILGRPVTKIPDRGQVEFIDEIKLTVAGTAGGVVVNTAKLGLKSLAVGAVGQDEKADFVIGAMTRLGIDTSAMQSLPGVPTSATILNIRPNGERPALHQRGASDHFDLPERLYDQVFDAPIVHLGGTGLLRRLDGERSVTLLKEAKRRGRTVTFDLIAASTETAGLVLPLLPYIDYFMPSIEEAQDMSGRTGPEECAAFYLDKGARTCVFTLGGEGAYYADADGTRLQVPAYAIDVVDTTGCGDAFDAGFITALHHRMNPEDAVRFAQGVAALVAGGLGSDAGVRSFEHTQESVSSWLGRVTG